MFDTSFAADLTIMEEGSELVHRVQHGGVLPMFTSCSPGWVKFVEQFYPEFLPNVSTCKSPQQMMGAVIKSFFAENEHLDPRQIVSVSDHALHGQEVRVRAAPRWAATTWRTWTSC